MSSSRFIREGRYAAEVEITLIDDEALWGPIVAKEGVIKIDRVRLALRRGDIKAAAKEAIAYLTSHFRSHKALLTTQ